VATTTEQLRTTLEFCTSSGASAVDFSGSLSPLPGSRKSIRVARNLQLEPEAQMLRQIIQPGFHFAEKQSQNGKGPTLAA
jgi:hypothetical protein